MPESNTQVTCSCLVLPVDRDTVQVDLYYLSEGQPNVAGPAIVIVPGAASKEWDRYRSFCVPVAQSFARAGFCAINFASRGQHPSGGVWSHQNMLADLDAIVMRLQSDQSRRIGLFGYSAGTSVALALAARRAESISSLALWATCFNSFYAGFYADMAEATRRLVKMGTTLSQDFHLTDCLLPELALRSTRHPVLLAYGTKDKYSRLEEQVSAFTSSMSSRSELVVLKEAGHALTDADPAFHDLTSILIDWFKRTL